MVQIEDINDTRPQHEATADDKPIYNFDEVEEELKQPEPLSLTMKVCPNCDKGVYYERIDKENDKGRGFGRVYRCYNCNEWIEYVTRERDAKYWKKPRNKKRKISDKELMNKGQLLAQIKQIKFNNYWTKLAIPSDIRDKFLISLLYLTAARIEEVVGLVNQQTREMILPGLRVGDIIEQKYDGIPILLIKDIPILKRKEKGKRLIKYRTAAIKVDDDKEFVEHIKAYMKYVEKLHPNQPLIQITYQTGWNISKKIKLPDGNNAFNHYWRHLRLSHLASDYDYNDGQLREYVGWADSKMAAKYVHLSWQHLMDKMIQASGRRKYNGNNS